MQSKILKNFISKTGADTVFLPGRRDFLKNKVGGQFKNAVPSELGTISSLFFYILDSFLYSSYLADISYFCKARKWLGPTQPFNRLRGW